MSRVHSSGASLLLLASLAACDEGVAPDAGQTVRIALAPAFESAAAAHVPVSAARIRILRNDTATVVRDTIITIAAGQDTLDASLPVVLTAPTETFLIILTLSNAQGDTLFRAGPTAVTVSSGSAPPPAPVILRYVGVGANAADVRITTGVPALELGGTATLTAVALDSAGDSIPGTPIIWRASDPAVATFPDPDVGTLVSAGALGNLSVVAELLTGQADTAGVLVVSSSVALVQDAIDSLESTLFTFISQAVDDPTGTRNEAFDYSVLDQISFANARDLFQAALAARPGLQTAAFGLAVTTLLALEDDPALRAYVEAWDVWQAAISFGAGDSLFQGSGPFPPTPAEAQPILRDVILPAVDVAIGLLSQVDSAGFRFIVTARMRGEQTGAVTARELDLTDVLGLRALLQTVAAAVDVALSYTLDPAPYGQTGVDNALSQSSTFGTLAGGGAATLADAHTRLLDAVSLLNQALDALVAETDPQTDDIVRYDPTGAACGLGCGLFDDSLIAQDVQDMRDALTDVDGVLRGPFTVSEDFGQGVVDLVIDVSRAFLAPVANPKTLLPAYQVGNGELHWTALAYDEWMFPDPTFGGVLPGIPDSDSLKQAVDFQGFFESGQRELDRWQSVTQSPLDGDLFAVTERGNLREVAVDFSAETDRPDVPFDSLTFGTATRAVAGRARMQDLTAVTEGVGAYTRPDDPATPWTERVAPGSFCCARFAVESPIDGSVLVMTDFGDLLGFDTNFQTSFSFPSVFYTIGGFTAHGTANLLVALGYDGLLFSRPLADSLNPWTQQSLTLPFTDFDNEWVGLAVGPSRGLFLAITREGDVMEFSPNFLSTVARPAVPATDLVALTANAQTGEFVALTGDGRIFTRPDDTATGWTLRTTLPRTILP